MKWRKPHAEIFEVAERRFGVPPDQLVFLDDMPANIRAAEARGWQAVQFTRPARPVRPWWRGLLSA